MTWILTASNFNALRSHSNANKKVIDTQCTYVLFYSMFACTEPRSANQDTRPLLPTPSGTANQSLRRPSGPQHLSLSLFDFPVSPKSFKIHTYKSLSKQTTSTLFRVIDLQKTQGEGRVMVNQLSDKDSCPEKHRDEGSLLFLVAQSILAVLGWSHQSPITAPLALSARKDAPCHDK